MLEVFLHALQAILILLSMVAVGYYACSKGWCDESGKSLVAKLVNFAIPFFLFYTVASKFTHDQLLETMRLSGLPFLIVGANYLVSLALVRFGAVRRDWGGTFIACFTGATTMFVGVPVIMALFGDRGLLYLLVYFFANVIFVWSLGLYHIKLDGIHRLGAPSPRFFTAQNLQMILSKPILGFGTGVAVLLLEIPVPDVVLSVTRMFAHLVSPLALIFVGATIFFVGFGRFRHLEREHWLVLASCFVLRPLLTWTITALAGVEPYAQQVLVISSAMPVTPVNATLARVHGGAHEFASEVIGVSVVCLSVALPTLILLVNFL